MSCSPLLFVPSDEHVSPRASLSQLQEGRRLYVRHCAGCHSLHLPAELTREAWEENVEEMAGKAKISSDQKDLILNFLLSDPDVKKDNP